MREIKFRGKRIDNDKWAYGNLMQEIGHTFISPSREVHIEVYPNTVGQYAGQKYLFKDLYEDDIIEIEYHEWVKDNGTHSIVNPFNEDQTKLVIKCICAFGADSGFHLFRFDDDSNGCYSVQFGGSAVKRKEIIGNIYEHKNLLA